MLISSSYLLPVLLPTRSCEKHHHTDVYTQSSIWCLAGAIIRIHFNSPLVHKNQYDSYCKLFDLPLQVEHVLSPEGSDPQNLWQNCRTDITKCSSKQLDVLQGCNGILCVSSVYLSHLSLHLATHYTEDKKFSGFRKALLDGINEFKKRRDWGMFIDSCFIHCQSMNALAWHSPSAARINNKVNTYLRYICHKCRWALI